MGAVVITDADPGWAREYEGVAARVRMVLGATLTRVDHIGSTSVPGLDAKDILDVQATVGDEALLDRAFGELDSRAAFGNPAPWWCLVVGKAGHGGRSPLLPGCPRSYGFREPGAAHGDWS